MIEKSFLFRSGFAELIKVKNQSKDPSLDFIITTILSDELGKTNAALKSIDDTTLENLRNNLEAILKNAHFSHFYPLGKKNLRQKTALKNYERKEIEILETPLKYLEETLESFAATIEAISTNHITVVSDEAHSRNLKLLVDIAISVSRLYELVTTPKILHEDLRNKIQARVKVVKEMKTTLESITGEFSKGRYPFTTNKELILARNKRDNWLDLCPSIVVSTLRYGYSKKGEKKRNRSLGL